jgi:hypothetical protein
MFRGHVTVIADPTPLARVPLKRHGKLAAAHGLTYFVVHWPARWLAVEK